MITLENNELVVSFPEIHKDAVCHINFQRTLRIPDDNRVHRLPPGLGNFPLFHVDDYAGKVPTQWSKHGGIFFPMRQAEAMWIRFHSKYPFAVKIASGKINAVTGEKWTPELRGPRFVGQAHDLLARGHDDGYFGGMHPEPVFGGPLADKLGGHWNPISKLPVPQPFRPATKVGPDQDYLAIPRQPWLDGFCVEKGKIRQFVAMPMGDGYTVEEQITGEAIHGGLQIIVYPLKPEYYVPVFPALRGMSLSGACVNSIGFASAAGATQSLKADMGLAPGGLMEQSIYDDDYGIDKWDQSKSARCFVHLLNTAQFKQVTGKEPPHEAPTAAQYTQYGLPWFSYYDETASALKGSENLKKLDSVANLANKKGESVLPENAPVLNPKVTVIPAKKTSEVRQGSF